MFLLLFALALSAQNDDDTDKKEDITVFEAFEKFFGSIRYFFAYLCDQLSIAFSPILPPIQYIFSTVFGSFWNVICILFSEIGSAIKYWQMALIQFIKSGSSLFRHSKVEEIPASTKTQIPLEQNENVENATNTENASNAENTTNTENQNIEEEVVNPNSETLHTDGEMAKSHTENQQTEEEVVNPTSETLHSDGEINTNDNNNNDDDENQVFYTTQTETETSNQEGSKINAESENSPNPTPTLAPTPQPGDTDFEIKYQYEKVETTTQPTPEYNTDSNGQHEFINQAENTLESDKEDLKETIKSENQNINSEHKVEIINQDGEPIITVESNETPAFESPLPEPNNTPETQSPSTPEPNNTPETQSSSTPEPNNTPETQSPSTPEQNNTPETQSSSTPEQTQENTDNTTAPTNDEL